MVLLTALTVTERGVSLTSIRACLPFVEFPPFSINDSTYGVQSTWGCVSLPYKFTCTVTAISIGTSHVTVNKPEVTIGLHPRRFPLAIRLGACLDTARLYRGVITAISVGDPACLVTE